MRFSSFQFHDSCHASKYFHHSFCSFVYSLINCFIMQYILVDACLRNEKDSLNNRIMHVKKTKSSEKLRKRAIEWILSVQLFLLLNNVNGKKHINVSFFIFIVFVIDKCTVPGPFAPPCIRRPKRNITARSYSCTTCQQIQPNDILLIAFYFHNVSITIDLFAHVFINSNYTKRQSKASNIIVFIHTNTNAVYHIVHYTWIHLSLILGHAIVRFSLYGVAFAKLFHSTVEHTFLRNYIFNRQSHWRPSYISKMRNCMRTVSLFLKLNIICQNYITLYKIFRSMHEFHRWRAVESLMRHIGPQRRYASFIE